MRRAKIVCTLGPATSSPDQIRALVDAGMDVARLNLSHGSHEVHEETLARVRQAAADAGRGVGVFADLQGPKIRLGRFPSGPVLLERDRTFVITTEDISGDENVSSTTYQGLADDVHVGDPILIDDGRVCLNVTAVDGPRVTARVIEGGMVSDNKGINLPGTEVTVPALSDKDMADLRWALRQGVDMIALSFVRRASDVDEVRKIMDEEDVHLPILAKIEKPQAVERLQEIITAFDGIMVARGDLGVELPLEEVPVVQKRAVAIARRSAKPVIVATQMLDSMISASRPTRAETSDVANAVLDGADALMLSGETSVGKYPIEAVRTMARIIGTTEEKALHEIAPMLSPPRSQSGSITRAAAEVGAVVDATYLVAFTTSGGSARRMSRLRSHIPLLAFTPEEKVRNQLALSWGIETFLVPFVVHTDEMVEQVDKSLLETGRGRPGDLVVIVAGSPPGIVGTTNAMRVHRIGDTVSGAAPAYVADQR
jgi:pyruvate kinase